MKEIFNKLVIGASTISLSDIKPSMENIGAAGALITIAQIVCYGIAVIIVMMLGIKFITSAPEGKAQIKERSTPALIGAVLLFSVGSVIKIVGKFAVNNI